MSVMTTTLGLVANIVVGIASGLAVQPLQRLWLQRANRSHAASLKQIKRDYVVALQFANNPEMLLARLIINAISIVMYGAFGTLALAFSIVWHQYLLPLPPIQSNSWVDWIPLPFLTASTIVSAVFIQRGFTDSLRLFAHVELIEEYVSKLPIEIRNLTWEADVLGRRDLLRNISRGSKNDEVATPGTK